MKENSSMSLSSADIDLNALISLVAAAPQGAPEGPRRHTCGLAQSPLKPGGWPCSTSEPARSTCRPWWQQQHAPLASGGAFVSMQIRREGWEEPALISADRMAATWRLWTSRSFESNPSKPSAFGWSSLSGDEQSCSHAVAGEYKKKKKKTLCRQIKGVKLFVKVKI